MDRDAFNNLGDLVRPISGAKREHAAVIYEGREHSYAALDEQSNRIANAMIAAGVVPGDRVAVLGKNSIAYADLVFATAKAGAIFVPLNWRLAPDEVAYIVSNSAPKLLFIEEGLEDLAQTVASDARILMFSDNGAPQFGLELTDSSDPGVEFSLDDTATLIYTSGTTGYPKGAMISNRNYLHHCNLDDPKLESWLGMWPDDVFLQCMPLFHVGGLGALLRPLFNGATVVLHREFDVEQILDDIVRYKVTLFGMVPTALQMILDHPKSRDVDFSHIKRFGYGAAPIPLPLLQNAIDRIGCDFVQSYGLSESNSACVCLAPEDHRDPDSPRLKAAGKPIFGAEVVIRDAEGNDLPPGEQGEICVRGSMVMQGYWRNPEATAAAIDADKWLKTGDAGYLDEDGYLYVCDRIKDMIISGGENVYPAEVESAVFAHEHVSEVAVVGLPDERWGERVQAVIVPPPGVTPDIEDIIAETRKRIAAYKAPRGVTVVSELPKNATGKILRRQIKAQLLESAKTENA